MIDKGFASSVLGNFFSWWWAALTGFFTLLSWGCTPTEVRLSKGWVVALTFVGSAIVFLFLCTLRACWLLYRGGITTGCVTAVKRSSDDRSPTVFLVEGAPQSAAGTIAEVRGFRNGLEVAFALVELKDRNSRGQYQAHPLWIAPGPFNELARGEVPVTELRLAGVVKATTLLEAAHGIAEKEKYDE